MNEPNNRPPDIGLDFGDDGRDLPADDPRFDAWISARASSLNSPPPTPRLDMWAAIESASAAQDRAAIHEVRPGNIPARRQWRRHWVLPAAIAAALVAGIGIDRLSLHGSGRSGAAPSPHSAVATSANPPRAGDPARLYHLAAVQTLSQAEALLIAYRASGLAGQDPAATRQLGLWGRQVLGSTRLLIDSPAGDDPQMRALLTDLELVLAQVIRLSGTPIDTTDRSLIDRAMRDRDLLPRIQTAVPPGAASTASDD